MLAALQWEATCYRDRSFCLPPPYKCRWEQFSFYYGAPCSRTPGPGSKATPLRYPLIPHPPASGSLLSYWMFSQDWKLWGKVCLANLVQFQITFPCARMSVYCLQSRRATVLPCVLTIWAWSTAGPKAEQGQSWSWTGRVSQVPAGPW